jgi:hypothetical protein
MYLEKLKQQVIWDGGVNPTDRKKLLAAFHDQCKCVQQRSVELA